MTTEREPIQITAQDIIRRPAAMPEAATVGVKQSGGLGLGQVKEYAKQIKELIDLARDMGIDIQLGDLFKAVGKKQVNNVQPAASNQPSMNPHAQFKLFLKILALRYGDITVNQLLENLRTEYGESKLSDLMK